MIDVIGAALFATGIVFIVLAAQMNARGERGLSRIVTVAGLVIGAVGIAMLVSNG